MRSMSQLLSRGIRGVIYSTSSSYSSPVPLKKVLAQSWEQKYSEYCLTTHFSQVSLKQTTHLCSRNAFGSVLHLTQTAITAIQYIKGSADRYSFDCDSLLQFGPGHNQLYPTTRPTNL